VPKHNGPGVAPPGAASQGEDAIKTLAALAMSGGALALLFRHESALLPLSAGFGPQPQLPEPRPGLFPTVNIALAVGWAANQQPVPAPGLGVSAFAVLRIAFMVSVSGYYSYSAARASGASPPAASSAWLRSRSRSSGCSMPTESRT